MYESVNKQKGNYDIYAQMLSCFPDVISNAIGIEVHNRNSEGYKVDRTLKQVYVLCSAFENDIDIVPVKLSIKEFTDKPNHLYVAVALESIKKDRVISMGVPNNRSHVRTSPVTISIRDLFSKINPKDTDFLKYIPNEFLSKEQIAAKQAVIGNIHYSIPNRDSAEDLYDKIQRGEITKEQYLDEVSRKKQENPVTIARLPKETANTTPKLSEPKRVGTGDKESNLYGSLLESQIITDEVKYIKINHGGMHRGFAYFT